MFINYMFSCFTTTTRGVTLGVGGGGRHPPPPQSFNLSGNISNFNDPLPPPPRKKAHPNISPLVYQYCLFCSSGKK